jgi:cytochrome c biogenesis protein CcdA
MQRALAAFRSITIAQSIVVAAIVAGTLYAFSALPDERLQTLIATIGTLGVGGTLMLGRRAGEGSTPSAPPPPPAAPTRRVPRRDGSAADWMLYAVLGLSFALVWAQRLGWL